MTTPVPFNPAPVLDDEGESVFDTTDTLDWDSPSSPCLHVHEGGKATGRESKGGKRKARGRRVSPQPRDYEVITWLARVRYATTPQVMRKVWGTDPAGMPPRQAAAALLGRLQRAGWVEQRHALPTGSQWPVYQCTRAGFEVATLADPKIVTRYIAHPSPGTLAHGLTLTDLSIAWEQGHLWLPEDFEGPVRVVSEREITATDRAIPKTPEKYKPKAGPTEHTPGSTAALDAARAEALAAEPVYGYSLHPGAPTRFPDALILPAGVRGGRWPEGAIAVEYEQTDKGEKYLDILRAYKATVERTARYGADTGRNTAKYRHVLYVSPSQSILEKVWAAAVEVGAEDLVLLMTAPDPKYTVWPERTTPPQAKRPGQQPVDRLLRQVPKGDLIEWLMKTGLAAAAVEALERTDDSLGAA